MAKKTFSRLFLGLLAASLLGTGCSSLANHLDRYPMGECTTYVFPGVHGDVSLIKRTYKPECETDLAGAFPKVFVPLGALDLPFSAVVDLVLLPIDVTYVPDGTSTKLPVYTFP